MRRRKGSPQTVGAVGVVHAGADLEAWWIWKDDDDIEPTLAVMDREDLLCIIKGSLRLELDGRRAAPSGRANSS
jgi:hypothetical protein